MDLKLQHFHWLTFKFMMQIELRLINSAYFSPSHLDSLSPLPPHFSSVSNQKSPVTPLTDDRHLKYIVLFTLLNLIANGKSFNFWQEIDLKIIFQNSFRFPIAFGTIYFAWWIERFLQFCTWYISAAELIDLLIFFSPFHHTSTRRISFSKREWHAIKSTFFFNCIWKQ